MKIIRTILGIIILGLDKLFTPKSLQRSAEGQKKIEAELAPFVLYEFHACPFCVRVRRAMKRLNIKIQLRDAAKMEAFKKELVEGGGKYQVPCLRIPEGNGNFRWLYESKDIVAYLKEKSALHT